MLNRIVPLVLGLVLLAGPVLAQTPPPAPPAAPAGWCSGGPAGDGCDAGPAACFLERLDLSDAQRQQIDKLREKGRRDRLDARKEMLRLRNELHGEMLQDSPDADRVRKLARQLGELRTRLQVSRLEQQLAVRRVLTPEQRDRLILMLGRHGGRHGGRAGWGGPGGGPGCHGPGHPGPRSGAGCRSGGGPRHGR